MLKKFELCQGNDNIWCHALVALIVQHISVYAHCPLQKYDYILHESVYILFYCKKVIILYMTVSMFYPGVKCNCILHDIMHL